MRGTIEIRNLLLLSTLSGSAKISAIQKGQEDLYSAFIIQMVITETDNLIMLYNSRHSACYTSIKTQR